MFLKALAIDPMFPRQLLLGFFGICAGSIIAAGVFAFSCFWSIKEVLEQRERVRKGWYPKNPKRKYPF